jgi:hypothetical protein
VPAPHQQAHPGQHPTPADQDDPPPIDVRVSASVEHLADGFRIIVTVSGRSNGPIELAASSAVRPAMTSTDQRCRPDGPRFLRCVLPRGTSSVELDVADPNAQGRATISVAGQDGAPDTHSADNTVIVTLP